jgi:hypothetical protein
MNLKVVDDTLRFLQKLDKCEKATDDLAPLPEDCKIGKKLLEDPTKHVVCSIIATPAMQALQYELNLLRERLGGVFVGLQGELQIDEIFFQLAEIRKRQGRLLEKELNAVPEFHEVLSGKNIHFDFGGHWLVYVFEELPVEE